MKKKSEEFWISLFEEIDLCVFHCDDMDYSFLKHKLSNIKTELMSFSSNKVTNPASKFLEFKSDDKAFVHWDKEQQKNVALQLPLHFVVLDELATITGYNDELGCGFFSNEVHSTTKEPLFVKSFKPGYQKEGLYNDIKGDLKAAGAKFAKSMYVLLLGKEENELVNLKLSGAAMSAWIDAKIDTRRNVVRISEQFNVGHKGKTEYNIPIFETLELTDSVRESAVKVDTVLQQYFKSKKEIANEE